MPRVWWIAVVVAVVVLLVAYVAWTAARVDRLHVRAGAAMVALDAQLRRRAEAAVALAESAQLPTLAYTARIALSAHVGDREAAENDLTRQLREVVTDADDPAYADLVAVSRRVALARQVHTDVVRDALAVRRRPRVRLLRLTRRHPSPAYFDVDDTSLDSLARVPVAE